ncbi:Tiny macrocysts protein B, partial [Tetrabaena socialis]
MSSVSFAFFRMFLDFLQLWLLVVNPSYGWVIGAKTKVWQVVSFIQLNDFLAARGYTMFLVLLYVFVGLLAINLVISVWVAHSFSNNRFEFVWPIQFLRWFGLIFYQVLDIATLTLLLVTLDCNYFNVPASIRFHNQEFPDVMCWSMPHIAHVGVSVASIVVFYIMASSMVVSEVELNPLTRNYMAMAHTRVEGIAFTMKVAATVASVMVSSSVKLLSIVYLICFMVLFYLHVKWVPFIYSTLNYVRCGSYATVLYCSILLVAMAFGPSADSHEDIVTLAMWIGMAPAAIAGAVACHLRLRHFQSLAIRFRDANPSIKSKSIYRFEDAREVEITARCCRRWIDEDTPEPEAVVMTELVIKAGMTQLPQDPYMIVLFSSFLIDVQGSYQSGYTQLQASRRGSTAKKQMPNLLEQFAIFSREQEHTQKASGANGGDDSVVDLVAYVEFQRNHRLVVRAHREALIAMRSFWGLLLRSEVDFNQLSRALYRIEVTVKAAERAYRGVLARHGSSARLVRLYGKFLEAIKYDPWAAAKWFTEADRLEEEAETTKEALQLGGVETLLPGGTDRGVPNTEGVAIICINAQSIIQVASPEAHALLGYTKNELKGKNIGIIMPAPFGDRHTAYVRNYIHTGVSWVLDRHQEVVVVTKTKQVLPVTLRVIKVSGLNEDSVFLGVIEKTRRKSFVGMAEAFTMGQPSLMEGADEDQQDMYENAQAPRTMSVAAGVGMTSTSLPRTPWRHKFGDPLLFDTVIVAGAPPALVPRSPAPHPYRGPRYWDLMLVSDQAGRILHATTALATTLGRAPDSIRSGGLDMLVPEPYGMLHGPYWQELSNPQSLHPVTRGAPPPPHSCRSGLAVSLAAYSEKLGPTVKNFRMSMDHRLAGGAGTKVHIVTLEPVTMEEALTERRLRLTVDVRGIITDTEAAPTELFGLYPLDLRGQSIARVVDLFRPQVIDDLLASGPGGGSFGGPLKPAQPAAGTLGGLAVLDGTDLLAEALEGTPTGGSAPSGATGPDARLMRALLELGRRASEAPDCSWRVGVMVLPDAAARRELDQLALTLGPEDTQVAAELLGMKTVPAVMRVRLVRKQRPAWDALSSPESGGLMPMATGGFLAATSSVPLTLGLCLEVELWRADLLSGVLEVDEKGKVLRADATCPLGQSGLLLGAPPLTLVGTSLANLLPLPPGGVEALIELAPMAGGVALGPDGKAVMRGGLKQRKPIKHKASEPIVVTACHQSDGCAVELRVQAVRRAGPEGSAYVVLHFARPTPVQPAFARWLYGGDTSGLVAEQARRGTDTGDSVDTSVPPDSPPGAAMHAKHYLVDVLAGPQKQQGIASASTGLQSPFANAPLSPPPFPGLSMQSISQARITAQQGGGGSISRNGALTASGGLPSRLSQSALASIAEVAKPGGVTELASPINAPHSKAVPAPAGPAAAGYTGGSAPFVDAEEEEESDYTYSSRSNDYSDDHSDVTDAEGPQQESARRGTKAGNGADAGGDGDGGTSGTDLEMESEAGANTANYGVGKRFKKLLRILSSPLAEQAALRLRANAIVLVVLMLIAHTVTFALLLTKLKVQKDAVMDLNNVAMASRRVHEIAINGRLLATLYTGNSYVEGLTQFGDPLEDTIAGVYDDTKRVMAEMKTEHHGVYLGFRTLRRIPTDFGLRAIWDDPVINITLFYDEDDPANPGNIVQQGSEGIPSSYRMMGLWDAGNLYLAKTLELYNNGKWLARRGWQDENRDGIVAAGVNFTAWSTWRFLQANGVPAIFPAYMSTLDAFVQLTVQESKQIYQLQLIILCLEGGLLSITACCIMWIMAAKVNEGTASNVVAAERFANRRHALYGVFIQIPIGVTRGLANMSLQLEAGEDEDEETRMAGDMDGDPMRKDGDTTRDGDASNHQPSGDQPNDKKSRRAEGRRRFAAGSTSFAAGLKDLGDQDGDGSILGGTGDSTRSRPTGGILSALMFWRRIPKAQPKNLESKSKRHLVPSQRLSYMLVAPFIVWMLVIVIVNLVGYKSLQEVAGALSTVARSYYKGLLAVELALWKLEVSIMMFGKDAQEGRSAGIPADALHRYNLAGATGVLFSGSTDPAVLLYHTEACICTDGESCQPDDAFYYQETRNGLDVLLKAQFSSVASLIHQSDDASGLNSTEFNMLWATGQTDMEGGLNSMSVLYHNEVQSAYSKVEIQQIAMFAIAWIWAVAFLGLQLRLFLRNSHNEMRRIAELLSQIPAECNVEELITRVIVAKDEPKVPAVPVAADKSEKLGQSDKT